MDRVLLTSYQSIVATTKEMKKLLSHYNNELPSDSKMSWEAASHLHEHSYRAALALSVSDSIPHDIKYEAVQKWRTIERCKEEICLLKTEMQNCIARMSRYCKVFKNV